MGDGISAANPFTLKPDFRDPLKQRLFTMMEWPIERLLLFHHLNRAYTDIVRMSDNRPFLEKVLDKLKVRYRLSEEDFARLMIRRGPVVVIANHPFGGIEGVILATLLQSVRRDVKFMANRLLTRIPEIRDLLIPVNLFRQEGSTRANVAPLRESIRWVKNGGMLILFPAGVVSHLDPVKGVITDPPWNRIVARIIRKTGAPVLPVFFEGANSAFFQLAGLIHPALRTALLPAEFLNKGRREVVMRVGRLIPCSRIEEADSDEDITEYLRTRTYLLAHRKTEILQQQEKSSTGTARRPRREIIAPPVSPALLEGEIRRLSPERTLVDAGDFSVLLAPAEQMPSLLFEIGRLRELTFRTAGEGTGKHVDIDRFDEHYLHLFIWNRKKREVVGSYRIGRTDHILAGYGVNGLYTNTLFAYKPWFFERIGPALEMGRSFVRPEYQRSYAPLLLLWKGVGRYITDNPRYKILFGPVSITDEYSALSRHLMVRFLQARASRPDMADLVRPRKPLPARPVTGWNNALLAEVVRDSDDVSEIVADLEADGKGIPILLKHYLKLGGKIIAFNRDPDFSNVLDGLIIVDLTETEPKTLERYLSKEGARAFMEFHLKNDTEACSRCA